MRYGWALLSISLLLTSCGRDFALPGGGLAVTDLTLAPTRLAAGETLTISFGVDGEPEDPPRVSLLGQALTAPEPEGGRYTLEYTALGTEPEAVDVVVEVSVSDGSKTESRFAVFRFDFTPPAIERTQVSHERVVAGDTLTLDFVLSEALVQVPTITLIDSTATDPVLDCDLGGLLLHCSRPVDGSETDGWISISTRLTDLAGNEAVLSHPVGAAFDASSAPVLQLGTLTPSPAARGMSVLIPLSSNLPLQGDPVVTVAGQPASRISGPDAEGRWVYGYFVNGTELGAQPTTGEAPLRAEATSLGGVPASLDGAVSLDFLAPELLTVTADTLVVDVGEPVTLALLLDEPTAAVSALVQGVPLACAAVDTTHFDCEFTPTGIELPGPVLLVAVVADFLGNSATRSAPANFSLDFGCDLDRERIFVVSNHLGERRFVAEPGAFEPGAAISVANAPGGSSLLDTSALPDGSVASVDLGAALRSRAYVSVVDADGHLCPTIRSRSRFIADFRNALAPNPDFARMRVTGTPWPDPVSLEADDSLGNHATLEAPDGLFAERTTPATAAMAWIDRGLPPGCPCVPTAAPMYWDPRRRLATFWYRTPSEQAVWGWDGSDWHYLPAPDGTLVDVDNFPPLQARSFPIVYDPIRAEALLFGGAPRLGDPTEDRLSIFDGFTWRYDTSWPRPDPEMSPMFAFDRGRGVALLFGGSNFLLRPGDPFSDRLWAWSGSRWREIVSAVRPPGRTLGNLTYDPARDQVVLFGGFGETGYLGDTWGWTGAAWVEHQPATAPSPRGYSRSVFHGGLGGVVQHGGEDAAGIPLDDLWLFDGQSWRDISPPQPRPALSLHGLTYDPLRGVLVAYGGWDSTGTVTRRLWELPSDAYYPTFVGYLHLPPDAGFTATGTVHLLAEGHGTLPDGSIVSEVDLSAFDPAAGRWILLDRIPSGLPSQVFLSGSELARFGSGVLRLLLTPSAPSSPAGGARIAVDHLLLEVNDD